MSNYKKPYHILDPAFADRAFGRGPKEATKAILGLGITDVCLCEHDKIELTYYCKGIDNPNSMRVCRECRNPPGYIAIHYIFECDNCCDPFLNWDWPDKDSFDCGHC